MSHFWDRLHIAALAPTKVMIFVTLVISLIFYTLQPSTTNGGGALVISRRPHRERASLPHTVGAVLQGRQTARPVDDERGGVGRGGEAADRNLGVLKHKERRGAHSLPSARLVKPASSGSFGFLATSFGGQTI